MVEKEEKVLIQVEVSISQFLRLESIRSKTGQQFSPFYEDAVARGAVIKEQEDVYGKVIHISDDEAMVDVMLFKLMEGQCSDIPQPFPATNLLYHPNSRPPEK